MTILTRVISTMAICVATNFARYSNIFFVKNHSDVFELKNKERFMTDSLNEIRNTNTFREILLHVMCKNDYKYQKP